MHWRIEGYRRLCIFGKQVSHAIILRIILEILSTVLIPELVTIGELASDSKIFLAIDINLN
jgi:hypothetical protein